MSEAGAYKMKTSSSSSLMLRRPIGWLRNEARKLHLEQGALGFLQVVRVATEKGSCSAGSNP